MTRCQIEIGPLSEEAIPSVRTEIIAIPGHPRRKTHVNTLITRSILAAALAAATPFTASAAQSAPVEAFAVVAAADTGLSGPIQLNDVTIQPSAGWQNSFAYPGLTVIRFTNLNASPATDIVFTVLGARGRIIGHIEDAGNYAQGQTVRHTFINNETDPNQHLTVEAATFAAGPVAPIRRRQSR
jgi:hypothetical protein